MVGRQIEKIRNGTPLIEPTNSQSLPNHSAFKRGEAKDPRYTGIRLQPQFLPSFGGRIQVTIKLRPEAFKFETTLGVETVSEIADYY